MMTTPNSYLKAIITVALQVILFGTSAAAFCRLDTANKLRDRSRDNFPKGAVSLYNEALANSVAKPPTRRLSDDQVQFLVRNCFGGLFRVASNVLIPAFVEGDFNGDGTRDVLVPVLLARSVKKTDRSRPPFNFQEVIDSTSPKSVGLALRMGNLATFETGPLFLVMHGVSANSCPRVRNKFVLLFAMDKGTTILKVYRGKKLPPGTIGDEREDQPPPKLIGDAVLLLDNEEIGNALYWDGTRYRWYPVNEVPR